MHTIYKTLFALTVLFITSLSSFAQQSVWADAKPAATLSENDRQIVPERYRVLQLGLEELKQQLSTAPDEFTRDAKLRKVIIELPLPYGGMSRFYVYRSSIMEKPLADQYPQIQTYACQGIDDPHASARIDYTLKGFHAMVLSPNGCYFIDPYSSTTDAYYISYYKKDFTTKKTYTEEPVRTIPGAPQHKRADKPTGNNGNQQTQSMAAAAFRSNGTSLRTYRIAIAATGEYTTFQGGTVSLALSAQITTLNRIIGVYRTELAVNFVMVANNTSIIYTNASTDPYTNSNGSTMLGQNQTTVDGIIGTANYDIGHVFSTGGGGVAYLASVCNSSRKAGGVTGSSSPVGDPFDIDYVAHEMGHQFGGNHSFNGNTGSCSGTNRNASTAYEPGSGSTIMAYAGICSPQDLQPHSDPYFHTVNFDEIITNITTGSTGATGCAVVTATGNNPPTAAVSAAAYTIPKGTPFVLTGSGSDPDGDPVTYYWEQFDLGSSSAPGTPPTPGPRFRSYSPTTSPQRIIPDYANLLAGTTPIGEILPTAAQSVRFRFTVRDNRYVGGGVNYDPSYCTLTVAASGPFTLTSPTIWAPGTTQTVTWAVNGTNASPVSCASVNILLSVDGGLTFPYTLASATPNDGSEAITVPAATSTTVRLKVEAVGNIFFAISSNFKIDAVPPPTITSFSPASTIAGGTVTITGTGLSSISGVTFGGVQATSFTINSATSIAAIVDSGATGDVSVTNGVNTATLSGFTFAGAYAGKFASIGTGTTSNTTLIYPAPYGNYYGGAKHQIIYTAAELTAAGFTAGIITQFGFNVSALVTGSLIDFTMKMGTTSSSVLSSFVTTGLTTVYTNAAYAATTGWNLHQLSAPFMWNGTSNLVVEVCFNNNNNGLTGGNTSTVYTTGLASGICIYFRADASATVCSNTTATAATSRPNGRFFLVPTPTVAASPLSFSSLGSRTVTLSWTSGNGGNRIVVCNPVGATAYNPANLTDYAANSVYGSGQLIGISNYVVYKGNGNTVTVTGLSPTTSYSFRVIEYNGLPGSNNYQTSGVSGSPVTTLPVTWLSFTGKRTTRNASLSWSTASETNNRAFDLERSANNTDWRTIATIKAVGNSNTVSQYGYTDQLGQDVIGQDLFYRVKQTDLNGIYSYSKVLFLASEGPALQTIKVQPNPASGAFTMICNATTQQPALITLFDELGLEVQQQTSTSQETVIDIHGLNKGMYVVAVTQGNNTSYQKVMVR